MKKDGKTVFLFLPAAEGCMAAVCARSAGVPSVPRLPSIFIDTYQTRKMQILCSPCAERFTEDFREEKVHATPDTGTRNSRQGYTLSPTLAFFTLKLSISHLARRGSLFIHPANVGQRIKTFWSTHKNSFTVHRQFPGIQLINLSNSVFKLRSAI